jgi:hypothetical protein
MNPGNQPTQAGVIEGRGTSTRSRSQSQPETTLGPQLSQSPSKRSSGFPTNNHLYQRPSRRAVLEPLNHTSPVNVDFLGWPSGQTQKLETIRSSPIPSQEEDTRSDQPETMLYTHDHSSHMWHNPQLNTNQEDPHFREPELHSETTLTPIHADIFGAGGDAMLEAIKEVKLSPRSVKRARSSPVPLNSRETSRYKSLIY